MRERKLGGPGLHHCFRLFLLGRRSRQFLADLQKSQKGKPNPMKGALALWVVSGFCAGSWLTMANGQQLAPTELSKLDDYKLYKVFKNREHRSYLIAFACLKQSHRQ